MSKDNLILFPKKRKSILMSQSEVKWMVSGSLVVVLTLALGVNSTLFSGTPQESQSIAGEGKALSRSIASINPIFRVSWEKKAFQVLEKTQERDLANVGKQPSVFDHFAFGALEGKYLIRKVDGKISEIRFTDDSDSAPKTLLEPENFLNQNLALFSDQAQSAKRVHVEGNDERTIEKFHLINSSGQDIGLVQVLLDKDQNLLSMTVQ